MTTFSYQGLYIPVVCIKILKKYKISIYGTVLNYSSERYRFSTCLFKILHIPVNGHQVIMAQKIFYCIYFYVQVLKSTMPRAFVPFYLTSFLRRTYPSFLSKLRIHANTQQTTLVSSHASINR